MGCVPVNKISLIIEGCVNSQFSRNVLEALKSRIYGASDAQVVYLGGLVAVEVYATFLHPVVLGDRLPFLPLMLTSVYSSVGMLWAWIKSFMHVMLRRTPV